MRTLIRTTALILLLAAAAPAATQSRWYDDELRLQAIRQSDNARASEKVREGIMILLVFSGFLGSALWFVRAVMENRRWGKAVAIQTDMQTKLLDRFGSGPELLAFMETDAGKRFLEPSLSAMDRRPGPPFPFGRILWSTQVGVVAILLGTSFLWLQREIGGDKEVLLVLGTVVLALGIGFIFSAGLAYSLSKSFGLLNGKAQ